MSEKQKRKSKEQPRNRFVIVFGIVLLLLLAVAGLSINLFVQRNNLIAIEAQLIQYEMTMTYQREREVDILETASEVYLTMRAYGSTATQRVRDLNGTATQESRMSSTPETGD